MGAENKVIKDIKNYVKTENGKCIKIHQSGFSELGTPDLLIALPTLGIFLVETKAKGKKPEPIQLQRIREWNRAGGRAFWCDSLDSFLDKLHNTR